MPFKHEMDKQKCNNFFFFFFMILKALTITVKTNSAKTKINFKQVEKQETTRSLSVRIDVVY